ncbi:BRO-N domain-containing protein [Morganella morganii]|uniref:BRO-N domain-containing protein n=1 Tax=Morganella morganii TaxID=582 RepID=UPI001890F65B|nr:BRO family protein [Morganella morganii]
MNSVAKTDLTFQSITFEPVYRDGQMWLTSTELAKALGYSRTDNVSRVYSRNSDEFTESMTTTVKMTLVRKTGEVEVVVRLFSLRGAHLIAMFASTPVAKQFRKWVLDILDREVAVNPEVSPLYRYMVKVTIMDTLFNGQVEFMGKANSFNEIATGVSRKLGFEPSSFRSMPMGFNELSGGIH